jgi:hypothetical protein
MKYIYLVFITVIFSLLQFSCDDYLEVTPENSVTFKSYFKTEKDLEVYTNGVRKRFMELETNSTCSNVERGQLFDDAGYGINQLVNFDVSRYGDSYAQFFWGAEYGIIASCNTLVKFSDKPDIPEGRKDFYKGQAHFYIAYSYFLIARFWGEAPIIREHGESGMRAKSSANDVLDYALENVRKAIKMLPKIKELRDADGKEFEHRNIPSKQAAMALYADIALWKAGMNKETSSLQNIIDTLTLVIDDSNFSLASTPEDVVKNVLVGDSQESIYELRLIAEETRMNNGYYPYKKFLGYPVFPGKDKGDIKYAEMRIKNTTVRSIYADGDLRRDSYFYKFEEMEALDELVTGGYAYPYKFRKIKVTEYPWAFSLDYVYQNAVLYRLSGLILLRAECYARLGKNGLAIADMNRIRQRSNASEYSAAEGDDIRYLVFKEREKELLWERKRYFDVIRNGYWKTEFKGAFQTLTDQDIEDGALYYPIGWGAFDDNPLMTQNRYWLKRY